MDKILTPSDDLAHQGRLHLNNVADLESSRGALLRTLPDFLATPCDATMHELCRCMQDYTEKHRKAYDSGWQLSDTLREFGCTIEDTSS